MKSRVRIPALLSLATMGLLAAAIGRMDLPRQGADLRAAIAVVTQGRGQAMKETVHSYLDAIRDHDIEKALSFLADDFELSFVDFGMKLAKDQLVDTLGWDFGANGSVVRGALRVSGQTISGVFTERNDFLELLGIPELKANVAFMIGEGGLIVHMSYQVLPGQPDWAESMKPAIAWAREHHTEELAIIYPDGQVIFNEEMARKWVAMLREWKAATASENSVLSPV